jgi:hypothetical protein
MTFFIFEEWYKFNFKKYKAKNLQMSRIRNTAGYIQKKCDTRFVKLIKLASIESDF